MCYAHFTYIIISLLYRIKITLIIKYTYIVLKVVCKKYYLFRG